jgi:hypothetical protein
MSFEKTLGAATTGPIASKVQLALLRSNPIHFESLLRVLPNLEAKKPLFRREVDPDRKFEPECYRYPTL